MTDPKQVIKEIIGRDIDWFKYQDLDTPAWSRYHAEAKQISESKTFNNELKHYITDLVKFITYEAKDFEQVLHTRTSIVVLETFKNRLKSIESPNKPKTTEGINEAI